MMYLKTIFRAAGLVLALVTLGQAAQASTCMFGTETDFTATADVWTSIDCRDQIAGNDSEAAVDGLFGINGWVLDSRYDHDTASYSPSGILTVSNLVSGALQGDWSVTSWSGVQSAMLVLKASNGYVPYLLDLGAGTHGEWTTQALTNHGGQIPAMSHVSLYVLQAAVPLPAAGLMLLGGFGLLAGLRRRRKA